jgi:hypothetical protein
LVNLDSLIASREMSSTSFSVSDGLTCSNSPWTKAGFTMAGWEQLRNQALHGMRISGDVAMSRGLRIQSVDRVVALTLTFDRPLLHDQGESGGMGYGSARSADRHRRGPCRGAWIARAATPPTPPKPPPRPPQQKREDHKR